MAAHTTPTSFLDMLCLLIINGNYSELCFTIGNNTHRHTPWQVETEILVSVLSPLQSRRENQTLNCSEKWYHDGLLTGGGAVVAGSFDDDH